MYKILDLEQEGYRQSTGAAPPCSGPSLSGESWQVSVAGERIFSPPLQKTTTKDNEQIYRCTLSCLQYLFKKSELFWQLCLGISVLIDSACF